MVKTSRKRARSEEKSEKSFKLGFEVAPNGKPKVVGEIGIKKTRIRHRRRKPLFR